MLGDLQHELVAMVVDMESVQNFRELLGIELDYKLELS